MTAYITSTGEPTTDLCEWSLKRNGFETILIKDSSLLSTKLDLIYDIASEDFLRVDADIIVNRNLTPEFLKGLSSNQEVWWWQFKTFDWYKQDIAHSLSFIKTEALPALRDNIWRFKEHLRPETEMSRIAEFYGPRRFETFEDMISGLHGYGIKDLRSVKKLKKARLQSDLYDFDLAEKLNEI